MINTMTIIAFPILIPLVLIIILIMVRSDVWAKWIGILGSALLCFISIYLFAFLREKGIISLNMGGWRAPFGIVLVIDYLSGIMLVISSIIVFTISIYAVYYMDDNHKSTKFYVFFFSLVMGVNGAFITGDAFNLYVWFEVMLMSSFVLITLGNSKAQLEGGIKYMALNLIGSLLFLAGLGLLYGKTGTLNMAHLAEILRDDEQAILINSSAMLFFIGFGIKAAVFPLFFWLPSSYHTPNITITTLFAGLLTKVGVYSLIRFFTLFIVQDQHFWHNLLLIITSFTMVTGGIAASAHYETRRILSYHIISQVGYIIMGLGIFTPLAIAGAIFFTIHNMIAKTNAFFVAGIINKFTGTFHLQDIGGLLKRSPLLAVLFVIPAFALAGVPPLSGFFAKFILIKAGIEDKHYLVTTFAVLTAMLTLYSMIKIWSEAFLKKPPEFNKPEQGKLKLKFLDVLPSIILGILSILIGVFAVHVFHYTMEAANQLFEPSKYIETVLYGTKP